MRSLQGHKVNPANDLIEINVTDSVGAGGANHRYEMGLPDGRFYCLDFQNGPIPETGVNGITQECLIAICIDRLECFQAGPFACVENGEALNHLLQAQAALHARTKARMARNVEGTHTV